MNPYRYDIQTLERKARAVRRHIVRLNANSPAGGHTGADLSQVELLTALYFRVLNVAPDRLDDPQRDIYIQSKGHAVGCYYCVLAEAGFFPVEWLETYQHANSHLPGHPVRQKTPGIERSNWEAALAAAHYGLDNLVIINDKNNLQLAGPTREIMNTDPLADKWRAFGMEVSECQGNDMASVVSVIEGLKQEGKPNVIIANTTKGAGISFIQGRPEWHHRVPKGEEIALALEELKDE
ncbi:transketolase [Klebsiella pneumoniae]|nr:transketolase [Klebsiella pneumoniae]